MPDPIHSQQRIVSLDVLRGFALLGILLMNIQSFAMPGAAYINPTAYGDLQGINLWVWQFSHVFADQKFMSLFSMLFGVGVLVFSERLESKGLSATGLHYRRMGWLLMFGLLHGYLFWYGDILFSYALCGMLVYLLRNKGIKTLVIVAIALLSVSFAVNTMMGLSIPYIPAGEIQGMSQSWKPDDNEIAREIAAYTGGVLAQLAQRAGDTAFMQSYVFLTTFVWRASGMMLLGMALFKSGFFALRWTRTRYGWWALTCLIIGLSLTLTGMQKNFAAGFSLEYSMFIGGQFNYWGSVFSALGYASMCMLCCQSALGVQFQHRLAAVGRMAFTNYIMHTLICTTLFYHLGLFGTLSRIEQLGVVVIVWVFQLIASPIWLKHYRFGPLEWIWRSLTYWHRQPNARQ